MDNLAVTFCAVDKSTFVNMCINVENYNKINILIYIFIVSCLF